MPNKTIAFIDDHPILLSGLVKSFQETNEYQIAGTGSATTDFAVLLDRDPDVLIVDLSMPGDVIAQIASVAGPNLRTKILVFTASASIDLAVRALNAGADGFVLKGSTEAELHQAINTVLAGDTFITPSFAGRVIASLNKRDSKPIGDSTVKFSVREDQIVQLLLIGRTNREIATRLSISEKTVKHYMTLLMQKLNARNRVEVVIAAKEIEAGHHRSAAAE
ncbi:response regulator transcription factor [Devosia sp. WQ 349]|uniref:LuxR C-terminal-related transcriptional regulator n=1 Tax=Devosia sp. WQ 349K1 TaxID=2800329 RepID=UPI0019062C9D|nr:response regulator transcription factor [Devosia sp. WQ 349K1]MBK1792881.1 response regulator transcription factor [Devosia sp. WQ 349K1]